MWKRIAAASAAVAMSWVVGGCMYRKAFDRTPVGRFEIKTLPAATIIETSAEGGYYRNSNTLFRRLFRYIGDHDVAMTVPVEGREDSGTMAFYVGRDDAAKGLADKGNVKVVTVPERKVASYGLRGAYRKSAYVDAAERLEAWCRERAGIRVSGAPYAVFWNSPFVPDFLKRFEVHVPITAVGKAATQPSEWGPCRE